MRSSQLHKGGYIYYMYTCILFIEQEGPSCGEVARAYLLVHLATLCFFGHGGHDRVSMADVFAFCKLGTHTHRGLTSGIFAVVVVTCFLSCFFFRPVLFFQSACHYGMLFGCVFVASRNLARPFSAMAFF